MVKKYQVNTSNITFELLESAFFWDIKTMLKWLKDRGFKIAMDDYGSDFSNLNRFLDLTYNWLLDYLKIDWEIVKKLREDKNQIISTLLTWTIDAVHKSWVKVVSEYVEDFELVSILTELGVDFGQWYFFSPPISEEQMKKDFWH
jgi:EAL domain-containing protein (putative c-di-GMP-specific phosphodiesterase class I)